MCVVSVGGAVGRGESEFLRGLKTLYALTKEHTLITATFVPPPE